jgi:hypothetical protein|tara:strand:- start:3843 stop:4190 length:348 start_codon:yes stop_codon:yes gene_type:complete
VSEAEKFTEQELYKKNNESLVLTLAAIRILHGERAVTHSVKEFLKNGQGNHSQEWLDKAVSAFEHWAKGVEEVAGQRFPGLESFGFDELCDLLADADPPLFELVITDEKCDICRS